MQTTVARLLDHKGDHVWTIPPDASIHDALTLMADKEIGALVVVEGARPIGILSERDYARKALAQERSDADTRVVEMMSGVDHTISREETTQECMELMTDNRIRHILVVEDDGLVGLISIGDVVRALIGEQKFLIEQLEAYIWS